jgi:hypothetical protein
MDKEAKKKEVKVKKDPKRKPDYDETEVPKVLKEPIDPPAQPLRSRKDYGESPSDAAMVKDIPMKDMEQKEKDINTPPPPPMPKSAPVSMPGPEPLSEPDPDMIKDYDTPPCGCLKPSTPPMTPMAPPPISEEVVLPTSDEDGGFVTILICPDCGNEGPFNMTPPPGIPMEARRFKCAKCQTIIPYKAISKTASGKYTVVTAHCMDPHFKTIRKLVKPGELSKGDASKAITALDKIYDKYLTLEKHMKDCAGSSC